MNKSSKSLAMGAVIALCVAMVVWTGIGYNTLSLYAAPVTEEFGIGRTQFMSCLTAIALFNSLGQMFLFGTLAEKLGTRRYFIICCILGTVGFAIQAFSQNFPMLLAGTIILGCGMPGLSITMANLVVDKWFKKNQTQMCSYAQTASAVGGIVFSAIWGILIANLGWRIPFMITVAIAAVSTIAIMFIYKGDPDDLGVAPMFADEAPAADEAVADAPAEAVSGLTFAEAVKSPKFYMQILCFFLAGATTYGVFNQLALFASDSGAAAIAGTIVSVALIAQAVGMMVLSPIADKAGVKWLVLIALVALIAGCAIVFVTGGQLNVPLLYVVGACVGFSTAGSQMPMGAAVREAFGSRDFGKILGIMVGVVSLGASAGPMIMSAFYDIFGNYQLGLIVMMVASAAYILMMFPATAKAYKD